MVLDHDESPGALSALRVAIEAVARHGVRGVVAGTWGESPVRDALPGSTPHKLLHLWSGPVPSVPAES